MSQCSSTLRLCTVGLVDAYSPDLLQDHANKSRLRPTAEDSVQHNMEDIAKSKHPAHGPALILTNRNMPQYSQQANSRSMGMSAKNVTEEINSFGYSAGIEFERPPEPEDISIGEPFNPDDIDITTRTMTIDLLLSRIEDEAIDLAPDFQRRAGIWNEEQQSRLIESLLLRIPLPTLYAAEDEEENWAIVDGIQRLSTIVRFISPDNENFTRLTLKNLEYLGQEFNNCTFEDLPPRLKRRLRETELVVHVIKHGTPEEVKFNIFARINTGGLPLSGQELRHALIPGRARDMLKYLAECAEFKSATDYSIRDERMGAREMALRFIAFKLDAPTRYKERDFDRFLGNAMRAINALDAKQLSKLEKSFKDALITSRLVFSTDAFRKRYNSKHGRYPINKALFETFCVAFSKLTNVQKENCIRNANSLKKAFMKLMLETDFDTSISQGTGDAAKVRKRFASIQQLVDDHAQ